MGANGHGGRPRGYRFFTGPCTQCGRETALSFTDPGYIWFRKHKPCGAFKVVRSAYEMQQKAAKDLAEKKPETFESVVDAMLQKPPRARKSK